MNGGRNIGLHRSERHYGVDPTVPAPLWTAPPRRAYSACKTGPCRQGRALCPSPEACQQPEKSEGWQASTIAWALAIAIACVVLACVIPGGPA